LAPCVISGLKRMLPVAPPCCGHAPATVWGCFRRVNHSNRGVSEWRQRHAGGACQTQAIFQLRLFEPFGPQSSVQRKRCKHRTSKHASTRAPELPASQRAHLVVRSCVVPSQADEDGVAGRRANELFQVSTSGTQLRHGGRRLRGRCGMDLGPQGNASRCNLMKALAHRFAAPQAHRL
jgi:hypothetical protein